MTQKNEFYRPATIDFDIVNDSIVPESLGKFDTDKEVIQFIQKNLIAVPQRMTVNRFMDSKEKRELREEYQEILEVKLPLVEKELSKASQEYEEAKKKKNNANELVSASVQEAKALANEVKRGVKEINLDDKNTWRVPFEGKYYFYTYIDKQLKLCKVKDIPDYEKSDMYNAQSNNDEFFNNNFGVE